MRISAIHELLNTEAKKVEGAKKAESSSKGKSFPVDKTEFSSKAQRLNDTKAQIDSISSKIAAEPDIRTEKVAEVKEKIKNGYYETADFVDKLADKLLNDFNIKNPNG
ncbi:MAG TPA: flagellar biosynthesis anti-sigma factor FlgM [Chitinivibrionales bacterium]